MKKQEIDMVHGPLAKKILLFTLPLMASNLLQIFFNAADVIVVGQFAGTTALSAVSANSSIIMLLTQIFIGVSVGSNVAAAKHIGEGRTDFVKSVVHTSIALSVIFGIFVFAICFGLAHPMLKWTSTPDDVIGSATTYLKIIAFGMPFLLIYNFGSSLLRAAGDTKRPMFFLLFSGLMNVTLNCIFVIVFHMDVAGVALATAISQFISAALVIGTLCRETGYLHLDLRKLTIDRNEIKFILQIGLPAGLQGGVFSISNVVIQSSVNKFGATVMAGSAAALSIGDFAYVMQNSFYYAALSFNGQNAGAKEYGRIDKVTILCLVYVFTLGTTASVLSYVFAQPLLHIYTADSLAIEAGLIRVKYSTVFGGFAGIMDVMGGCIRGMGYSTMPTIVSLIGSCLFRIIWVLTIFQAHSDNIIILYISYPISWVLTFLAHAICFLIVRKKFRQKLATA